MDFNVIDFRYDPSQKGLNSIEVSIQEGKRTEARALRSILGCAKGIDKPLWTGGQWDSSRRGGRNAEGSTELLSRGRLQVALREGEVHLGPVARNQILVMDIHSVSYWKTGLDSREQGLQGSNLL